MHSLILSWIYRIFIFLRNALYESRAAKLFNKIYTAISESFFKSKTAGIFSKDNREDSSLIHKICYLPFTVLGFLCKLIYKPVSGFAEKSIFAELGRVYFNCFAALNSRFFGVILLTFGVLAFISSKSVLILAVAFVGILLLIKSFNLSDYLSTSFFVRLFQNGAGFKNISFNFYKKEKTTGNIPLALGILTGLIMGVISAKSILLALLVPFGIFGMLLVLFYPIAGIFAAVFLAPLLPTMVLAMICLFTLVSLFLNKACIPDYKWKTNGVGTALILLLLILLISSIFSFDAKKSLMVWAMYLVFFSFYFVIINTVETREQLYSILKVFVLSGAIVSVYGILQYIFKWNTTNSWIDESMFEEATMRAYSTLENPNVLGEYLLLLLPISFVFMLKLKAKELSKWVYAGIFAVSAICLVFTQSRGCWLGFLLACAIIITFYKGKLWAIVPIAILLLPFVLPETIIDRIMSIGNMSDSSTSYRVYIWYGTMEMLRTYFIGGIGMGEGAFGAVYPLYSYDAIIAPHSHNLFLQLTVEAGIGALIVFITAIFGFFKSCTRVCKKSGKASLEYLTALAFSAGVAGFMLQSMFDYTFYNYRVMAIFVMYLALGTTLKIIAKETEK